MNDRIDKFFASKLGEHTIEPGDKAWSRIAANLPKKNNTILWFRAAAGIAIAGLAFMLWFNSSSDQLINENVAQQSEEIQPVDEKASKQDELLAAEAENNSVNLDPKPATIKKEYAQATNQLKKKAEKTETMPFTEDPVVEIAQVEQPSANVTEQLDEIDLTAAVAVEESSKPIVIVFELKEITKKENPYELDLSPQKKSGIKKVLEIANDVRTGGSPIGGLRQAKEDIFAFNFKKEDKNINK